MDRFELMGSTNPESGSPVRAMAFDSSGEFLLTATADVVGTVLSTDKESRGCVRMYNSCLCAVATKSNSIDGTVVLAYQRRVILTNSFSFVPCTFAPLQTALIHDIYVKTGANLDLGRLRSAQRPQGRRRAQQRGGLRRQPSACAIVPGAARLWQWCSWDWGWSRDWWQCGSNSWHSSHGNVRAVSVSPWVLFCPLSNLLIVSFRYLVLSLPYLSNCQT